VSNYKSTRYYRLPTAYGDLVVWANGQNDDGTQSVGFRTIEPGDRSQYSRTMPEGGADDMPETVTINRVAYRVHGFARIGTDGRVTEMNPHSYGGSLTRAEMFSLDKGSESANRAFDSAMTDALEAWAITDYGRQILREGRHISAHNEADQLARDLAELDKKRDELKAKIRNAERMAARNAPAEVLDCAALGDNHSDDRVTVAHGTALPLTACGFHAQNWTAAEMLAATERKARRNR
jgi:hypothetical protein